MHHLLLAAVFQAGGEVGGGFAVQLQCPHLVIAVLLGQPVVRALDQTVPPNRGLNWETSSTYTPDGTCVQPTRPTTTLTLTATRERRQTKLGIGRI